MRISTISLQNLMSMMLATVSSLGRSSEGPKQTLRLPAVIKLASELAATLLRCRIRTRSVSLDGGGSCAITRPTAASRSGSDSFLAASKKGAYSWCVSSGRLRSAKHFFTALAIVLLSQALGSLKSKAPAASSRPMASSFLTLETTPPTLYRPCSLSPLASSSAMQSLRKDRATPFRFSSTLSARSRCRELCAGHVPPMASTHRRRSRSDMAWNVCVTLLP